MTVLEAIKTIKYRGEAETMTPDDRDDRMQATGSTASTVLWCIGTGNNVGKWNPETRSWDDQGLLGGWTLLSLAFDADGAMWCVGTENNVGKWNPETRSWDDQGRLGGWMLLSLAFDADGAMWCVGTENNVGKWNPGTRSWDNLGLLGGWTLLSLAFDESGDRWCVGTENNVGKWSSGTDSWDNRGALGGWTLRCLVFNTTGTQYFWIINAGTSKALAAGADDRGVVVIPLAYSGNQLWLFDPDRQAIFSRTGGPELLLALTASTGPGSPLRLAACDGGDEQRWTIDSSGYLTAVASGLVVTEGDDLAVSVQARSSPAAPSQRWYLQPYVPSPDDSTDQFRNLLPGQLFSLRPGANAELVLAASGGPGAPLRLVREGSPADSSGMWHYKDGAVLNAQTGLAITATGSMAEVAPLTRAPEQQWAYSNDGHMVCRGNNLVLTGRVASGSVALDAYDPVSTVEQTWLLQPQDPVLTSTARVATRSSAALGPSDNITRLLVKATVSTDLFAGTADKIYISLGSNGYRQMLFNDPKSGDSVTVEINIQAMFGRPAINIGDLTHIWLYQDPVPHPIASDAWKLGSLLLIANGEYTNYTFQRVERWIDNPTYTSSAVWSGALSWGSWLDGRRKPIDLNCATYPVGLIPYLLDIKSWRSYDPSTIDGVGQLVGVLNGQLIGERLNTRQCEILQPTTDQTSYTWVFTPDGSIIYTLWDHNDRRSYTRHSQLGSGQPVICAGEMEIRERQAGMLQIENVIAMVNDSSGHYKPDGGACLWSVAKKLQELGIPTDSISWYWRAR
jgi:hypothetical protein